MDSPGGGGGLAPGTPGSLASPHAVGADCTPETVVRGGEWQQQQPPPRTGAHSTSARLSADSIPSQQRPASQHDREPSAAEETLCAIMIAATWPGCSPQFTKALCRLMLKGQSMEYYGAAAKKGADAQGRWLQAKRAALACSQEQLKKSGAGGGAGTSVAAEAWHMYVHTNSPEFRGLMTALVSLGLEFQSNEVGSAPETDDLLFFKWTRHGPAQDGLDMPTNSHVLYMYLKYVRFPSAKMTHYGLRISEYRACRACTLCLGTEVAGVSVPQTQTQTQTQTHAHAHASEMRILNTCKVHTRHAHQLALWCACHLHQYSR